MNLAYLVIVLVLTAPAQRQFFDEDIPCLQLNSNCGESSSPFKDDDIEVPYNPEPDYYEVPDYEPEEDLPSASITL